MSLGEQDLPQADIVCWDAGHVFITCPYCDGTHRHGRNFYTDGTRVAHCDNRRTYRHSFPFDQATGNVTYEIDKRNARFVNVCRLDNLRDIFDGNDGEEGEDDESEDENQPTIVAGSADAPQSKPNMREAAQEAVVVRLSNGEMRVGKCIDFAVSGCVTGKVARVRKFLENSRDSQIFLHGELSGGDTTLMMACMGQSSDMVHLLLDHGADPNAANKEGRTALMEAALWGRLDNVKVLMSRGAYRAVKDFKNRAAVDFAKSKWKNERERHKRAVDQFGLGGRDLICNGETCNRETDRREIARLLGGDNDSRPKTVCEAPPTLLDFEDSSFRRSSNDLSVVFRESVAKYPMTTEGKTVARLERGKPFPTIAATSGWSHLKRTDWTAKVFAIARKVGHTLPPDDCYDDGVPGRTHASHAEKQLIAQFIERHVFLEEDQMPCSELDNRVAAIERRMSEVCSADVAKQLRRLDRHKRQLELDVFSAEDSLPYDQYGKNDIQLRLHIQSVKDQISNLEKLPGVKSLRELQRQLQPVKRKQRTHKKLTGMAKNRPPVSLTKAVILASSPNRQICDDCESFKDKVNEAFGLSIEMRECTEA